MAIAPDMAECAARAAIAEVIHLYCHLIDRRRWDLMERCFHPDATYRFAAIGGGWRDFVAAARATIDPLPISHHQAGNILFRIDGDRATTETYFSAYHRVAADASPADTFPGGGTDQDVVMAGRYIDRFECRDGDWRIVHRIGLTDWRRENAAADGGLFAWPAEWRGSIGDDDAGFAVVAA